MCTTLVLDLHDFIKTFFLECDASRRGIGADPYAILSTFGLY
jgi:hypothetical protein